MLITAQQPCSVIEVLLRGLISADSFREAYDSLCQDYIVVLKKWQEGLEGKKGFLTRIKTTLRLTDLLINETITKEAYDRKFSQLQSRHKEISVMQEEHQGGNEECKNALTTMVSLASKALDIFKSSKIEVKRALIGFVFSNLQLNGSKLEYTLREPFQSFQNVESYKGGIIK